MMPKASMALAPAAVQRSLMRRLGPRIRRWILAAPHWCRVVMDRDIEGFVSGLQLRCIDKPGDLLFLIRAKRRRTLGINAAPLQFSAGGEVKIA